jgi:hypothetical protein
MGRKRLGEVPLSNAEKTRRSRAKDRLEREALLDSALAAIHYSGYQDLLDQLRARVPDLKGPEFTACLARRFMREKPRSLS